MMAKQEAQQGAFMFALQAIDAEPAGQQAPVTEDWSARRDALAIDTSILVQAPAGAGKTDLLTKRFLRLLAEVEAPEQILAITFTRAATAEMRSRILGALERAGDGSRRAEANDPISEESLARAALQHAEQMGWRLLEQPHRLDVQTIDSLCLRLAGSQPLLARLGGALEPTENAPALYAAAARRTTAQLAGADRELDGALRTLLLRRDNNLREVEGLIGSMLARRDAWLGTLPLSTSDDPDWTAARARLEQPFAEENRRVLGQLRATLVSMPELAADLLTAARYAAANLGDAFKERFDLRPLRGLVELPRETPVDRARWEAIASLLLTQESCWRSGWNVGQGFPAAGTGPGKEQRVHFKKLMEQCGEDLQAHRLGGEELLQLLCQLRRLPALGYSDDQWQTLLAAFRVLRRATVELRVVFAETNAVDFVEIAQAAEAVLHDENSMRGLLESERKQHLLIDEFQDTSRAQYRLVSELLREWTDGDGRTVFLVGDPLQSIYGFRQAEVALFHETRERGIPCGDSWRRCAPLQLTHNFRSHRALVDALNMRLEKVFSGSRSDAFVPAQASVKPGVEASFHLHAFFVDASGQAGLQGALQADAQSSLQQRRQGARLAEAAEVVRILADEQPRIAAAQGSGAQEYRVAVLVQSRAHLAAILPALRAAGIPFRAVELEPLADQPEVHDLLMLLRALLHAGERVAWLTALRAPWCGLGLADLHLLTGADDPELLQRLVIERIPQVLQAPPEGFSTDGLARLARTWAALEAALATRYAADHNASLAAWLERTWFALGGDACVLPTARENAESFFRLLDTLEPSGVEVLRGDFAMRLAALCAAPDTRVSERFGVQLMTMHKAKGLGFEVVLLPGLERSTRSASTELVAMLERARASREGEPMTDELLLAPLDHRDSDEKESLYSWVAGQKRQREADERKRLLYVACTRARSSLHLFATMTVKDGALRRPTERSLLGAAWPGLTEECEAQWRTVAARAATVTLAASATGPLDSFAAGLEQLPSDWHLPSGELDVRVRTAAAGPLFPRAEGSQAARAGGTAMHALLEQLSTLFATQPEAGEQQVLRWRGALERKAARVLRTASLSREQVQTAAAELAEQALAVACSTTGRWLLTPHAGAASESAWQSWDADGNLRTLRVDRSFLAGERPGAPGESCLWIIDYKTGARRWKSSDPEARERWRCEQQTFYGPQLAAYGRMLVAAGAAPDAVRYALYFPELLELVDWLAVEP